MYYTRHIFCVYKRYVKVENFQFPLSVLRESIVAYCIAASQNSPTRHSFNYYGTIFVLQYIDFKGMMNRQESKSECEGTSRARREAVNKTKAIQESITKSCSILIALQV